MKILVSACLLGVNCRYCGTGCKNELVCSLMEQHQLIPVCPEQLGGLATPRKPSEIISGRVINQDGEDVTNAFQKGAEETFRIARLLDCSTAVLKSRSPSCGYGEIYDGSFTGTRISGNGITAELLSQSGITIYNEDNCNHLRKTESI